MKRTFDLIFAAVGLLFTWPVILVCVVIARRDTGSSGLFIQERVGQHGKLIRVCKVRTMRRSEGAESTITVQNDSRITRSGAVMRRYKLDELPQLWNVLVGDMSFVGPRPDVPGYADRLSGEDRRMLLLRPGITGPATLKYRHEEQLLAYVSDPVQYNDRVIFPDKVLLNIAYMNEWSLGMDIRYILMTLGIVSLPNSLNV